MCKRLEKIQRDFLWGGGNLEKKPHLVSWATVCTDKKVGGLGVRGLHKLNKALLGKWLWRFANERNSLWRKTIRRKFGESQGGWCSGEVRNSFGTDLWKEIRKGWDMVRLNAKFVVGDGSRIRFWKDVWGAEEALCITFPTLFSLVVQKDALIREIWDDSNEGGWIPRFSRPFNDWELIEVVNFMKMTHPWRVVSNREDKLVLKGGKPSLYSVKLLYEVLNRTEAETRPFPALSVWNTMVPLKVGFFAWEAYWGKVMTLDQLKKRGRSLANRCYLCEEEEETLNHLLVHCSKARMLWELIFGYSGVWMGLSFLSAAGSSSLARNKSGQEAQESLEGCASLPLMGSVV